MHRFGLQGLNGTVVTAVRRLQGRIAIDIETGAARITIEISIDSLEADSGGCEQGPSRESGCDGWLRCKQEKEMAAQEDPGGRD